VGGEQDDLPITGSGHGLVAWHVPDSLLLFGKKVDACKLLKNQRETLVIRREEDFVAPLAPPPLVLAISLRGG
jgi:hypothetical protein